MGYEPVGCRVAIIPENPGKVSSGGLIIPEICQDMAVRASGGGVVCGVGPKVSAEYCTVREQDGSTRLIRPGDYVRHVTYAGVQFYNTNEVAWTRSTDKPDEQKPDIIAVVNDQDVLAIWVPDKEETKSRINTKKSRKG